MKVLAALSGGVDSSVMAALLLEQGHEVVGATMKLWGGESDSGCCSVSDVEDARRAAAQLGIDHHVFNFTEQFNHHVVDTYVDDHAAGRTPNPCIECNRHLKFDVFLRRAEMLGFDAVATGHHARVHQMADGSRRIARGEDQRKDQSYVLYTVDAADLENVLLPIGEMTKAEVRRIAGDLGLRTARKPESQDVCFITRTDGRQAFLDERTELHPGRVMDSQGNDLGTVEAVEMVTIGQRRGLNLAGGAEARYVTDVDVRTATVTVGTRDDLLSDYVDIDRVVWAGEPVTGEVMVQTSAHGQSAPAVVRPLGHPGLAIIDPDRGRTTGSPLRIDWVEPHRRVAPGQSVVMYQTADVDGRRIDYVVGGGIARPSRRG